MGHLVIGLCVVLFASANAFYPLIPEGKELIYSYRGLVRASTHEPLAYGSAFILDGHLHVQTDKNSSFMHFSDLKFKLYNGEYDVYNDFDTNEIPLPKELEVLEHPFKVVYEPCGHASGIVVEKDEPQFAVNMKRGVASFMQMYTEKLDWTKEHPYAFHTKEHSLYGKGPYYYTVFPGTNEWTVKKMAEPHSYRHLYSHLSTNSKMSTCDAKFAEPLSRDSNQEYHIIKKDGAYVMDRMESNAGIDYTPYAGEGYNFFIYMNQTMKLTKIVDAAAPMTIKDEKCYKGLTYYTADFGNMQSIADIMHGRRTYDMDKMLVELEEMLCDTMKYIHEYHMDMKSPDWARGQLVNRMLILMFQLDETHLEAMTAKLMQKTSDEDKEVLHLYYHMLPMVGSHASYMYMMKLMKTKKIKDNLAVEWLHNMPFHAKEPNKMLIEHMSEMLNWGDEICMEVRKAAILAFSTFIDKAMFRHNKLNHINTWSGHKEHHEDFAPDHELNEVFPGADCYEKYITLLAEKMKACDDTDMHAVYITALYNTHMEKAVEYLLPIVQGELFADDSYLRLLAIKSLGPLINVDEEMIYNIFWPIMSNYQLCTNLRVAAFEQIMNTHPSLQRMNNMLLQMAEEPNYAFYQIHYSYLKAVAETTDPCMEEFRTTVKQILAHTTIPEHYGMTGYYKMDYMDEKYENGHQFAGMLIHSKDEHETTMQMKVSETTDNAKFELHGILIHVEGIEASIFDDVMLHMKDPNKMINFDLVWKAYKNIYNNKEFHMDIAVSSHGQIISTYHLDASNIKELAGFVDLFVGDKFNYVKKYVSICYHMQTNVIMPTEIGFPALFKIYVPSVNLYDIKLKKEIVNNMITLQCDTHLKKWAHGRIGLSIYNPFIDMYQGVQKIITFDWVKPLYFDLSLNPAQQSMKLTWKRHEDPQKDTVGMKSYGATFTFFRDDMKTGMLKKSSPESHNWEMVTFDKECKNTRILYDNDCSTTGLHHVVSMFESDGYASNMSYFKNYDHLESSQNYHTRIGHMFLTHAHLLMRSFNQPHPYAGGILIRSEVSKVHPVTNIDMNIRFNRDYKRGSMMLSPATKWNMRATYTVKNKETTMKTWDANLILDSDMGHTKTDIKAVFSHAMPGHKDVKVCVDATRKYVTDGIDGEMTISLSHAAEAKCTKEENIMEIKLKAEKLPEQIDNKHMYRECEEMMWSDIENMHSLECYLARDSLRRWTFDLKTFKMTDELKKNLHFLAHWHMSKYMKYMTKFGVPTVQLEENAWRIINEYPLVGNQVDMHIYTPELEFQFGGIPACDYLPYDLHMKSTEHFSPTFKIMHNMGWTEICEVQKDYYYNTTADMVHYVMPQEWTMYLGDAETDAKHGIWMKNLDGKMSSMKMQHGEHSLEIIPTDKHVYEIIVDGKKLPTNTYQYEQKWFWMDMVKETGIISVFCMHSGSHMVFDGQYLLVEQPNMDIPFYGKCA